MRLFTKRLFPEFMLLLKPGPGPRAWTLDLKPGKLDPEKPGL